MVAQTSGTGPGVASVSWNGSGAVPGICDLSISPGVTAGGGGVSPTDCYIGVSYAVGGDMLIMGTVNDEPDWSRCDVINEMIYVANACLERQVKPTLLLDPAWTSFWRRVPFTNGRHWVRGLDYWLGNLHSFRNLFLATHGVTVRCADGVQRTRFEFSGGTKGVWAYYTNGWGPRNVGTPAFTDFGTGNYPWNIVEVNACFSAGNFGVSVRQGKLGSFTGLKVAGL